MPLHRPRGRSAAAFQQQRTPHSSTGHPRSPFAVSSVGTAASRRKAGCLSCSTYQYARQPQESRNILKEKKVQGSTETASQESCLAQARTSNSSWRSDLKKTGVGLSCKKRYQQKGDRVELRISQPLHNPAVREDTHSSRDGIHMQK